MLVDLLVGPVDSDGVVQLAHARCRIVHTMREHVCVELRGDRRRNARVLRQTRYRSAEANAMRGVCTRSLVDGFCMDGFARRWPWRIGARAMVDIKARGSNRMRN